MTMDTPAAGMAFIVCWSWIPRLRATPLPDFFLTARRRDETEEVPASRRSRPPPRGIPRTGRCPSIPTMAEVLEAISPLAMIPQVLSGLYKAARDFFTGGESPGFFIRWLINKCESFVK